MNLNWRCLLAMVIGITFSQSPALAMDCELLNFIERKAGSGISYSQITVVGVSYNANRFGIAEEMLSERDRERLARSKERGVPVLLEERTNTVYPLYLLGDFILAAHHMETAGLLGVRATVTGCVRPGSEDNWLRIEDILNDVEPLP